MLSRITRSRAQLASNNDENVPTAVVGAKAAGAGPVKMTGKRPQIDEVGKNKVALGTSVVGALGNKIQRSALGDISNVGGLVEPAGKKPTLKPAGAPSSRLASLPVVPSAVAAPTASVPIPVQIHVQPPQAQLPIAQSHVPSSQHVMLPRTHEILESKDDVEEVLDASISDADMDGGDEHTNQTVHLESLMLQKPAQQSAQPQPAVQPTVQAAPTNMHPSVHHAQLSPSLCAYDIANANNAQAVTELAPIVMRHLKRSEVRHAVNPNYMASQTDINPRMREILIDWLNEVHQKFKLRPETLYLTVVLIDKFLEKKIVSRSKLQLVGCTAMLLASKYEEVYAPEVRDFVYISDSAYTKEQILGMEAIMLSTLQFFLTIPSCFRFAERYWNVAQVNEQQLHLVNFFMELTLQDYSFLKFLPSKVAASALYLALKVTGAKWTPVLESHTELREEELWECAGEMLNLAANENSKYRAVRKKYSSRKFLEVSTTRFGNFQIPTSTSSSTSSSSSSSLSSSGQGGVSSF